VAGCCLAASTQVVFGIAKNQGMVGGNWICKKAAG